MILDLQRFIREGRPSWEELDRLLGRLERDTAATLTLEQARRLHYLYQKTSADLARVNTFAAEPEIRAHLESLVGRAYGEIHRQRTGGVRWSPWRWFVRTFPQAFRRRAAAFVLACVIMLAGGLFGAGAVLFDPEAKPVIMPFEHLLGDPKERVAREEHGVDGGLEGGKATFSGMLMTHNIRVAIFTMALGVTWGFGTVVLVFYNGVILGAVIADYLRAGEGAFLTGWLLPHGSVEIPAILVAAQAGFVLGAALMGWKSRASLRERLREAGPDVVTLIGGVGCLLVWAGVVEAFFSQYHEPVVPYVLKIAFGFMQLAGLACFLALAGGRRADPAEVRQ